MAVQRTDLASFGVRVNAIAPGEIDTAILSPRTSEIVDRDIPMRRLGTIEEVANLIWFLCSAQASYITGVEIPINGGQHA
jgi:NAD(P)-dependent dehydrogenase (short-subunit alcohol dehydrogenase family)